MAIDNAKVRIISDAKDMSVLNTGTERNGEDPNPTTRIPRTASRP